MSSVSEVWRPVVGHETTHEVSNLGRVRTLPRVVPYADGRMRHIPGKYLKGHTSKFIGYRVARIEGKLRYIHHLVLEAFVCPRPLRHEACHCNGKRDDNRLENLRWDTPQANQMDRARHGTSNRGERCGTHKLTEQQAIEILQSSEPGCVLAARYGMSQQGINAIRKGRSWWHLGIKPNQDYQKAAGTRRRRHSQKEAVA